MRKNILTNILLIQTLLLSGSGAFGSEGPPDVTIPGIEPVIHGDDDRFSIAASFSTSNRYVTEGIDNVPGSAFIFSEVVGDYKGLALGVWYAEALSDAYNELNVFTEYTLDLDPVEIFAGVNYLYYPSGADSKSWEVYAGIEWTITDWVAIFAETYYDFDAVRGGFLELGIVGDIPLPDERVSIQPYIMLGIDYGYVSGVRHLRENDFQIGVTGSYALTEHLELFASVSRSFALSNLNAIGEGNVTWGTVGIGLAF